MISYKEALETRYLAVCESSSDRLFYKNVHAYISYILKTPQLLEIIDQSVIEYGNKHKDIWSVRKDTDEEIDDQADATEKLEFFSLYASSFVTPYVRIYLPIEDYKTSNEPDYLQDPVALLMLKGFKYLLSKGWDKKMIEPSSRWSKKNLEIYNRWFDGKREFYQNDIKQFHFEFLNEIENLNLKNKEVKPKSDKALKQKPIEFPLSLHERTGDFTYFKTTGNFTPKSQEFKILNTLITSPDYLAEYLTLLRSILPNAETVSKPHKSSLHIIIRNIKEKLGILPESKNSNPNIIVSVPKMGYRLIYKPEKQRAE